MRGYAENLLPGPYVAAAGAARDLAGLRHAVLGGELEDLLRVEWPREVKALAQLAAQVAQAFELGVQFDALRHHLERQ